MQKDASDFFYGIIDRNDKIDISICNPPFHASVEDAQKEAKRKVSNLTGTKVNKPKLNFSGMNSELIYPGGEYGFIHNMIKQSKKFASNCFWFSTLVSKQANLIGIYDLLDYLDAELIQTIPMDTGNKSSRIIAWSFLTKEERQSWRTTRWKEKVPK